MPPKPIGNILSELMARRGYAQIQSASSLAGAWQEAAAGPLVQFTRVGEVRRGVLDVVVSNSTLMQELSFQKSALLAKLKELAPEASIRELRFRVGQVS